MRGLDEVDPGIAVAGEEIDYGDFNHRVAAGLETECGAGTGHEDLSRKGRVVDGHIEFEALAVGLA